MDADVYETGQDSADTGKRRCLCNFLLFFSFTNEKKLIIKSFLEISLTSLTLSVCIAFKKILKKRRQLCGHGLLCKGTDFAYFT